MDYDMVQDVELGVSAAAHYDIYAPAQDEQMMTYGASPASTEMLTEAVAMKASSESVDDANEVVMVEEFSDSPSDVVVEADHLVETTHTYDETHTGTANPVVLATPREDVVEKEEKKKDQIRQNVSDQEEVPIQSHEGEAHDDQSDKDRAEDVIATPEGDATSEGEALTEAPPSVHDLTDARASGFEDAVADQKEAGESTIETTDVGTTLQKSTVGSSTTAAPVRVAFNGQDFVAFGSAEKSAYTERDRPSEEISAPTLNIDLQVAHETLDVFFEALRFKDSLGDFLDEGTELSVLFVDLDLTLREDDIYAREVTIEDIRRIHAGLGHRHTPHLIIVEGQRFITRYNELASQASVAIAQQLGGEEDAKVDLGEVVKEAFDEEHVQTAAATSDEVGVEEDGCASQAEDEGTEEKDQVEEPAGESAVEDAEETFVTVDNVAETDSASASEEEYTPSLDQGSAHSAEDGIPNDEDEVATAYSEDGDYRSHREPSLPVGVDDHANGSALESADYVGETYYVEKEEGAEEVTQDNVDDDVLGNGTAEGSKVQTSSKRPFEQESASLDDDDESEWIRNDGDPGRSDSKRVRYDQAEDKVQSPPLK